METKFLKFESISAAAAQVVRERQAQSVAKKSAVAANRKAATKPAAGKGPQINKSKPKK